jgi:glycerol-3-phosphate dehydrogenase
MLCQSATREDDLWRAELLDQANGERLTVSANALINAGGPWVADMLNGRLGINSEASVRLVRGSHIVTRRLYAHDKCYFLQQPDGRIIFAIPYETDFTLIGTTDVDHVEDAETAVYPPEERDYLLAADSLYF